MMKKKVYTVTILGLGRIAYSLGLDKKREQPASHSHAFGGHPGFRITGACDIDPHKRERWQPKYKKAAVFVDYETLLKQLQSDIVVIALPEELHLAAFRECCAHRPSLVVLEKPIAANLADAREILRLQRESGQAVMVNHERRYARDYQAARNLIASGSLGSLKSVRARILTDVPALKKGDDQDGQSCLIHDGTHLLDMVEFLSGERISVQQARGTGSQGDTHTEGVVVDARLGDAALYMEFGMGSDHFEFEIEMDFVSGRLRIGNGILELFRSRPSPYYQGFRSLLRDPSLRPFKKTAYFSAMVHACYKFLSDSAPIESTVEDSVHYLGLIEDIRRFLK